MATPPTLEDRVKAIAEICTRYGNSPTMQADDAIEDVWEQIRDLNLT